MCQQATLLMILWAQAKEWVCSMACMGNEICVRFVAWKGPSLLATLTQGSVICSTLQYQRKIADYLMFVDCCAVVDLMQYHVFRSDFCGMICIFVPYKVWIFFVLIFADSWGGSEVGGGWATSLQGSTSAGIHSLHSGNIFRFLLKSAHVYTCFCILLNRWKYVFVCIPKNRHSRSLWFFFSSFWMNTE